MATKMKDQIKFGQWESLPRGSQQRQKMEKEYIAQHHVGGGSISDFFGDVGGALGHTLSHPMSSGVHGLPGYGTPAALLATILTGGTAAPAAAEGLGATEGGLLTGEELSGEGGLAGRAANSKLGKAFQEGKEGDPTRLGKIAGKVGRRASTPSGKAGLALLAGGGALAGLEAARGKKNPQVDPGQAATTTSATSGGGSPQNLLSPSIMPLFMQSIVQPYMKSILDQINSTSQGYGNYMNNLIGGGGKAGQVALNPLIAQALGAMVPGQQASMNLLGQSAAGSAVAGSALDQLNQAIQEAGAAQKTAQGEYEKQLGALYAPSLTGTGVTIPGLTGSTGIPGLTAPTAGAGFLSGGGLTMQQQLASRAIASAGG